MAEHSGSPGPRRTAARLTPEDALGDLPETVAPVSIRDRE